MLDTGSERRSSAASADTANSGSLDSVATNTTTAAIMDTNGKPKNGTTNSINGNYGELNLNMSASEMRKLLAQRKRQDPKNIPMDVKQKYAIIQQM